MKFILSVILLFCLSFIALPLYAIDISWDGGGDGTTWSDTQNWDLNQIPGPGDHVIISLDGTYTIHLTANVSIQGITLGGISGSQTLDANGFLLALGVDSSSILSNGILLIGGTTRPDNYVLSINGPLILYGRIDWGNGCIYSPTYYLPPAGKMITIEPSGIMQWVGTEDRIISSTLENQGTLKWLSGNTFYYQGYNVSSSGIFDISPTSKVRLSGRGVNSQGPWIFKNSGIITKKGKDTVEFEIDLRTIGGSVDVQQGTVIQLTSSRWENANISVADSATLHLGIFSNNNLVKHTISGSISGKVNGTFLISGNNGSGSYITLIADTIKDNIINITGKGFQIGSFTQLSDNSGTPPFGALVNRGLMRIVGDQNHLISGTFTNEDTLKWESGKITYYTTGAFTNKGVFLMETDIDNDFTVGGINGNRPGPFFNTGIVRKIDSATVTSSVDFFNINGKVEVLQGTLHQTNLSRWENTNVDIDSGATLQLGSPVVYIKHIIAGTLSSNPKGTFIVTGPGQSNLLSDTAMAGVLKIGGTGIQIGYARLGGNDFTPPYQAPTNRGLMRFVGTQEVRIQGDFINEDTIIWESGTLNYSNFAKFENNGYFEMSTPNNENFTSIYEPKLPLFNKGIIRKLGTSKIISNVNIQNSGQLAVVSGSLIFQYPGRIDTDTSGIISGSGYIELSNSGLSLPHRHDGITAPGPGNAGAGIGTLTIRGDLPHKRMEFEIGGADSALYDQLVILESSTILDTTKAYVDLINGFQPVLGDYFDVVHGVVTGKLQELITKPGVNLIDTYPPNLVRLLMKGSSNNELTVRIGSGSAYAGEKVKLPIILNDPASAVAQGITSITVKFTYNATLLEPTIPTIGSPIIVDLRSTNVTFDVPSLTDSILGYVNFRAGIGDASSTQLHIDTSYSNLPNVKIKNIDGIFNLLGVCEEGGKRLLNPSGTLSLSLQQNPISGNSFSILLHTIEKGKTQILLSDILGNLIRVFYDDDIIPGDKIMDFNLDGISNGTYFLTLKSPTRQLSKTLEVLR